MRTPPPRKVKAKPVPGQIFDNPVLVSALISWGIAQGLKIPIEYLRTHHWNWGVFFSTGGMPSAHTTLMTATALTIGLFYGFNDPLFGLAVAVAMVVIYDATGIRRQAGYHARRINMLINELFSGQPISDERLKEVLGHTPREVVGGITLGTAVSLIVRLLWH